jgi:hypothetical protein
MAGIKKPVFFETLIVKAIQENSVVVYNKCKF